MAVVVFVAEDFGCLYGYYHVQMLAGDKKRGKQEYKFYCKKSYDKVKFVYLIML